MKSILENRPALAKEVNKVAEVAGYLWQKGWAERNGGNITVNITEFVDDEIRQMKPISDATYDLRSEYLGEENGIFEESGVYNMIGENIIELVTPSSGAKTYYKVLDDAVVLSDSTEIFNNSGRLAAQYILKRQ